MDLLQDDAAKLLLARPDRRLFGALFEEQQLLAQDLGSRLRQHSGTFGGHAKLIGIVEDGALSTPESKGYFNHHFQPHYHNNFTVRKGIAVKSGIFDKETEKHKYAELVLQPSWFTGLYHQPIPIHVHMIEQSDSIPFLRKLIYQQPQ